MFFSFFLAVSLFAPQAFSNTADPDDVSLTNQYAVDPDLISTVSAKIDHHKNTTGNKKAMKVWTRMLNALYGNGNLKSIIKEAKKKAKRNYDNETILWSQLTGALETVEILVLFDYDYDYDPDVVKVIADHINHSVKSKRQRWLNILRSLYKQDVDKAIAQLKSLKRGDRPPEWEQMISKLEGYEEKFIADVQHQNAYSYDIHSVETGEKIASVRASSSNKSGSSGDYSASEGKTHWEIQFAGTEGNTNYLSYGYWANSRRSESNVNYNERQSAVFFHGDDPSGDVNSVKGHAVYSGETVGVWQYNTTEQPEVNRFTGDVNLVANFNKGNISGTIKNLADSRADESSISNSLNQINLGLADFDSNGRFNGHANAFDSDRNVVGDGEWNGGFYNQSSPEEAPEQVGGDYSLSTGKRSMDIQIQGAFGADLAFR